MKPEKRDHESIGQISVSKYTMIIGGQKDKLTSRSSEAGQTKLETMKNETFRWWERTWERMTIILSSTKQSTIFNVIMTLFSNLLKWSLQRYLLFVNQWSKQISKRATRCRRTLTKRTQVRRLFSRSSSAPTFEGGSRERWPPLLSFSVSNLLILKIYKEYRTFPSLKSYGTIWKAHFTLTALETISKLKLKHCSIYVCMRYSQQQSQYLQHHTSYVYIFF